MLQIDVLGPLAVSVDDEIRELQGPKLRSILAVLAARANEPVHRERLVEELDLEKTSKNTVNAVQAHITRLRRWLDEVCGSGSGLVTVGHSYRLDIDRDAVDAHRFTELTERAWALGPGRPDKVAHLLTKALALWRGDAMADVGDGPMARGTADALQVVRLDAQESLLEALLELGDVRRVILLASRFIARDPLRERLWELMMAALHRSGRYAEAVDTFHRARRTLVNELGVEPCPRLRALLAEVLDGRGAEPVGSAA